MLLAINVGNSDIRLGVFEGERLKSSFSIGNIPSRTADEYELIILSAIQARGTAPSDISGAIIGSVSPSTTEKIKNAVKSAFGITPMTVGPGLKTGFSIRINDPSELGADLVANAAATIYSFGSPSIICDFDTVTSISVIGDGNSYLGGSLMTGIPMSLEALKKAELLPSVTLEAPTSPLGKTSRECMNSGIIYGQAMACSGFIKSYKKALSLPENTPIVVTGSSAEEIIPFIEAEVIYDPQLTLKGLSRIYALNFVKRSKKTSEL